METSATATIPRIRFESQAMGPRDAFDFWREVLSRSWDMSTAPDAAPSLFSASISVWHFGDVVLGTGDFEIATVRRREMRHVRADSMDHYKLVLFRSGFYLSDADGVRTRLDLPGQMLISDMARPEFTHCNGSVGILYIPRELLDQALPHPLDLHGVSLQGAAAGLLASHMSALIEQADGLPMDCSSYLMRATISLLAACISATDRNCSLALPVVDASLVRQVTSFIDKHMSDAELGPERICGAFGLSRASLYRLMEPFGGVSALIRERRLKRIHALLSAPDRRLHLSRVSDQHGFRSPSQMSRAFRAQFGYSPSDAPSFVHRATSVRLGSESGTFSHWLMKLQSAGDRLD